MEAPAKVADASQGLELPEAKESNALSFRFKNCKRRRAPVRANVAVRGVEELGVTWQQVEVGVGLEAGGARAYTLP